MQGRIEINGQGIIIQVPIELMKEGDRVIVYTHALDICGYGNSADEAKKDFDTAVRIFFQETIERNTFEKALEELGWKKIVVSKRQYWEPQTEVVGSSLEEIRIPA
jgi:hypothetical protein